MELVLTGKLNFIDEKFGQHTFSITEQRNVENYPTLEKIEAKLKALFKDSYLPLFRKTFKETDYYSLSGRAKTNKELIKNQLYIFSVKFGQRIYNGVKRPVVIMSNFSEVQDWTELTLDL